MFVLQDRVSLFHNPGCPGTSPVGQTGLGLTKIHLTLPPEFWEQVRAAVPCRVFITFLDKDTVKLPSPPHALSSGRFSGVGAGAYILKHTQERRFIDIMSFVYFVWFYRRQMVSWLAWCPPPRLWECLIQTWTCCSLFLPFFFRVFAALCLPESPSGWDNITPQQLQK